MSKGKKKGPGSRPIILLLGMGAMGLTAFGAYVKYTPADKVPPELHRPDPDAAKQAKPIVDRQGTRETSETSDRHGESQRVLVPKLDGERVRLVPAELKRGDAKVFVLNKTLEAFKMAGAKTKSVNVVGGIARVDFNAAVQDGMGSMEEGTFLKAIQMGLGQFKEVDMIEFTVDGESIETLGGHLEVVDPVPVIRPAGSAGATQP